MSRVVRSSWPLVVILVVFLGVSLGYASCSNTKEALAAHSSPLVPQQPPVSPVDLQDAMLAAGLDAKALTAVGLSAQAAGAFVDEFRDDFAQNAAALTSAETSMASAQVSSDALRRKIQSGKGSGEDVTAYNSAMSSLATAKAAKETALAASRASAEATLNETQRTQLARIRANKHWELPMEFLLVDRTEAQWVALRDALANEKIAPRYGEETAQQHATVLSAARSNEDVALAKSRLESNLSSVSAALHAAIVE